ncbi:MAG: hypothetical protein IKI56_08770 [Ruminococcus sp.]|nr:hypothetical protein [Ruminococcus sp.]
MDIELYIDSKFQGFFPLSVIEEHFDSALHKAEEMLPELEWDDIILYAILAYDEETEALISADLMCLCLSRYEYSKLYKKLSRSCRLFTLRK